MTGPLVASSDVHDRGVDGNLLPWLERRLPQVRARRAAERIPEVALRQRGVDGRDGSQQRVQAKQVRHASKEVSLREPPGAQGGAHVSARRLRELSGRCVNLWRARPERSVSRRRSSAREPAGVARPRRGGRGGRALTAPSARPHVQFLHAFLPELPTCGAARGRVSATPQAAGKARAAAGG